MIDISIKVDVSGVLKQLAELQKQIPFAIAKGLTDTAKDAAQAVTDELPRVFDRPNSFTRRAVGFSRATKQTLTSTVFIRPKQAEYLRLQIEGGTRHPRGRSLALPTAIARDQYGGVSRATLRRLRARKDVFSGKIRGIAGLWQRTSKGTRLLLAYESQAKYSRRLPFEAIVRRAVATNIEANFRKAIELAIRTAR